MDVGTSIKELRESHDLTQEQLGKIADVSAMAVSQWEHGRAVPRMGSIQKMADYFGVPKSAIMGDRYEYAYVRLDYTTEELELIECYRTMSPRFQQSLLDTARAMSDSGKAKNNQISDAI